MTYATEKVRLGREPFSIVELDLDYCSNLYGGGLLSPLDGTCTASGPTGLECYNTYPTCQDTANYVKSTKTYKFCSQQSNMPIGQDFIPCLVGEPKFTPTEIKPDKGVSIRATVSISVKDFSHHDRGIDPYVSTRTYDPETQGTFFGRMFARNLHYRGRLMRVKTGYIGTTYSAADFQTKLYVIDSIEGPYRNGDDLVYNIIGKDILKLADDSKVKIPAPTDGTLSAGITSAATSLVLASTTTLADYPTGGGVVIIGSEYMIYTSRSSYTISGLTRGDYGTTAAAHATGDAVQIAKNFTGNPVAIIDEILETYAGIDGDTYIPYDAGLTTPTGTNDEWDDEEDDWLVGINLDVIIGESMGAIKLLNGLCEVFQIDLWWDETTQKIKLKVNAPPLGDTVVTKLTHDDNLIESKTKVRDLPDKRISRVVLHYDRLDASEGLDIANLARHHFEKSADAEDTNQYDEVKEKVFTSLWLSATEDSTATQTAQRLLSRFSTTPKEISFEMDAKDSSIWTGSLVDIDTKQIQDSDGSNKVTRFQIISAKEIEQGHRYQYKGLSFYFTGRIGYVADNALDTTSPKTIYTNASNAEKAANAFAGPNTGVFPDGGELYTII